MTIKHGKIVVSHTEVECLQHPLPPHLSERFNRQIPPTVLERLLDKRLAAKDWIQ